MGLLLSPVLLVCKTDGRWLHRFRGGGDRPGPGGGDRDRPPAGERPRLNLAPRSSAPKEEPKVDDDGFATVTKKR